MRLYSSTVPPTRFPLASRISPEIFTVGRMRNPAGEVTAEAEGIFISVNFGEKFGMAMPGPSSD